MKFHGITLEQGSNVSNLTVASGTAFPGLPDHGELFFRSDSDQRLNGLYIYIDNSWSRISSKDSLSVPSSGTLPSVANEGDLFYLDTDDANEGLYIYRNGSWTTGLGGGGGGTYTISGDVTGTIDGGVDALTLSSTGVTAGTYKSVTVDIKGRVTAGTNPTTLAGYGITDAQPLDTDLSAIAALVGTSGLLRKTATDTWALDTATYLTANQTITLSGDATGSGTTSISITLANSGVTAGTYKSVTVDAKGRVTAGTNPTTLSGYGITDAQPLDADLTAIAALAGTSGFLKKTAADTWSLDTATYLTGNQTITLSGDVSGSGTTTISATLANSGVTAGTYKSVTVDVKGRVTAGTNPTTLAGYGITDAQPLDADLTALAALSTVGLVARTGTATFLPVSLAASGNGLTIQNATGATGNPTVVSNATDLNTQSTIVFRDASGNFAAGTITASLTGNASTATNLETPRGFSITGDVTAPEVSFNGGAAVALSATLANTTVSANSYGSTTQVATFTVDSKGRLTAAANASIAFPVTSVASRTGAITLTTADIGGYGTVSDSVFTLQDNTDTTKQARFEVSGITTATTRTFTLPNTSGTLAVIDNFTQTFAGATTFSNGTVTVGSATGAATYGIGTGATTSGNTKTINIGTSGAAGSTTTINIGSANGTTTTFAGTVLLAADPTALLGAATKQYVDNVASGMNVHQAVRAATTTNLSATYSNGASGVGATLTGTGTLPSIDGVTLTTNDRVLVKNQTTQSQNGIYQVTTISPNWVLTRTTDFDNSPANEVVAGDAVFIQEGSQGTTQWVQTTTGSITIGTSNIVFTQFGGPGVYSAGAGLSLSGTTFNVGTASAARIVVNADDIDLASVPDAGTGSFLKFTRDTYGRVSGTVAVATGDITTALGYTPANKAGDIFSGAVGLPLGTLGAPSLYFTGDTNTGIWSPAGGDNFAISTAGAERFRIDGSGNIFLGGGSSAYNPVGYTANLVQNSSTTATAGFTTSIWNNSNAGTDIHFLKSRGAAIGTRGVVVDGDNLGLLVFAGDDGTNFPVAATIQASVNGTPAANSVPGALIFSVTPAGGSITEAARITSAGSLFLGTTTALSGPGATRFTQAGTSFNTASASWGRFSGDTDGTYLVFEKSRAPTIGTYTIVQNGDTLGRLQWRGADGTTSQPGAEISIAVDGTPAAGVIPSRFVFQTENAAGVFAERMRLNSEGNLGVGGTASSQRVLATGNSTGATTMSGITSSMTVQSDVTSAFSAINTSVATQAATFTLGELRHFTTSQGTFGLNSTVTNQYGFFAHSSLIGATNNYGFFGDIPAGTNRWNIFMSGTANNYMAGSLGIGTTGVTANKLIVGGNLTGASSYAGVGVAGTVQNDVTTAYSSFSSFPSTQAATFSMAALHHFNASQGTFGAGTTVTHQYGFRAQASLVGATNNYAFVGEIPASTGDWNLMMSGTANNHMAGKLLMSNVNDITVGGNSAQVQINGNTNATSSLSITRSNADVGGPLLYLAKGKSTVGDTATAVVANDQLGSIIFSGTDTATYGNGAVIRALATATWTSSSRPTALSFQVTPSGATGQTERIYISPEGGIGLSTQTVTGYNLRSNKAMTGATYARNIYAGSTPATDVTSGGTTFESVLTVGAGVAMTGTFSHFYSQVSAPFTGTLTTQHGYYADSTLVGATNNHGFYGNIPSGTGRWNVYMNGTAQNYFAGNVGIGTGKATPATALDVNGTVTATSVDASSAIFVGGSAISTVTTTVTTTTPTVIDNFAAASFRSAKFLVQIHDTTNSHFHMVEIMVIHDGTTVWESEYGEIVSNAALGTFDTAISGGNVNLTFTPTAATNKNIKVLRTAIAV